MAELVRSDADGPDVTSRAPLRAWLGGTLAGVAAGLVVAGVVLQARASSEQDLGLTVGDRVAPLTFALFAAVAGLITVRRPRLVVGWLLLGFASLMALGGAATGMAQRLAEQPSGALDVAAWLQSWVWVPAIVVLAMAMLLFPDGRLPSRRWRHALLLQVLTLGAASVLAATLWPHRGPGLLTVDDQWPGAAGTAGGIVLPAMVLGFVIAVGSLVQRYRTAAALVRQQLKWLLLAVAMLVSALLLAAAADAAGLGEQWMQDLFGVAGLLLLPVAIGAAILRYRLFEIDRVISRTVAWLLVTAVLGGTYVASVLLLGALLPTDGGDVAVALATLAAAALFQPVRARVQTLVNRRFDRARYDASRTIDAFGRHLRGEVSRDAVVEGLRRVAGGTFGTASAWVLLVDRSEEHVRNGSGTASS